MHQPFYQDLLTGEHVLPWVGRRLRRESSGEHRPGKCPDWTEVDRLDVFGTVGP